MCHDVHVEVRGYLWKGKLFSFSTFKYVPEIELRPSNFQDNLPFFFKLKMKAMCVYVYIYSCYTMWCFDIWLSQVD